MIWLLGTTVSLETLFKLEDEFVVNVLDVSLTFEVTFCAFLLRGFVFFLVGEVTFVLELVVVQLLLLSSLFKVFRLDEFPFSTWGLDAD